MVSLATLEQALDSLCQALSAPPKNDLERDGAIQRFEYTFELAWKTAKRVLQEAGIDARSPRAVIRELLYQGWIDDGDAWMSFLAARNKTTHIYRQEVAEEVFQQLGAFAAACTKLLHTLKAQAP